MIAATHRDLESMIDDGAFREDLYYGLRVVEIVLPPLRERRDDIPLLAAHMISSGGSVPRRARRSRYSPMRRSLACSNTIGPATFASWRTVSHARSSSHRRVSSARSI